MRRIASFVARRVDKADAPSTTSSNDANETVQVPQDTTKRKVRTFDSLSRKWAPPLRSHVLASNSAYSSSSASSGSGEPRTPDEEVLPRTLSQKGSWRTWLGAKKEPRTGKSSPPFALHAPPRPNDTDDTSSDLEDDVPVSSITHARDNMKAIVLNSFVNPHSYPPLLDIPGSPSFPRSCLHASRLRRRDTLASKMHKTALLRKLCSLSPAEQRSILPLGARPTILVKEAPAHNSDSDTSDTWPKAALQGNSSGLSNWVDRPCFEDRVVVWTMQEPSGPIVCTDVAGSQFGVAALEFSEPIQILAGWVADEPEPEPEPEHGHEHGTTVVAMKPGLTVAVDYEEMTSPKQEEPADPPAPRIKRGVRFADDGKDDQIPLGYIVRIKKKREEKAKFLLKEREKRDLEEANRAKEQERQLRMWEAEKRQQEKERIALELQKKKDDEERRQHNYAAELQASRARRDASRAGQVSSSSSSLVRDMERDRSVSRDARPSASRTIDTANLSPYDGSPASSMPATPQGSQRSFSRPPSVYSSQTTSSEDARARDGRHISRRSTLAFDPSKQSLPIPNHRASLLPYNQWTNLQVPPVIIPQVSPLPVVPMMMSMPYYPMEIPLLPPSPPFMMNQFGYRQRPPNFAQGRFSSYQQCSVSNHSGEGTHRTSRTGSDPPASFSTHQRRASDDVRSHSNGANVLPDRKYGSQTDLRVERPPQVVHSSRASNLHHSRRPSAPHPHAPPGRPLSTSQSRPTSNRRQTVYS